MLRFGLSNFLVQVWVIEFSPNITPVASKVSSKIRETYLKDYDSNDISSTPQYGDKNRSKSAGTFEITGRQGNIVDINSTPLLISIKVGFSSVDDVMTAVTINNIGKDADAPPIYIGSSVEDVIGAMGTPESIQISFKSFKYRNSTIFFDDDWKVQSWDNRYGNLKVSLEDESGTNDNLSEISKVLTTDKDVESIIKEFQELLENQ